MLLNCRQRTYKIGFQKNFDHLLQPVEARHGYVLNCKTIVLFGSGPGVFDLSIQRKKYGQVWTCVCYYVESSFLQSKN